MTKKTHPYEELMNAAFSTKVTDPSAPRYMWYAPIGHVKVEGGRLFVMNEEQEYEPATEEEVAIWNELARKLRK